MQPKPAPSAPARTPSVDAMLQAEAAPTESLAHKLIERFQSSAYQPPLLADVAARVVELSRRPFKPTEAIALLERDAFFAGRILQVAQSPVHSGGAEVTSLAEAVTRLGQATLAPVFLNASTKMRVFRNRLYLKPMEQVQTHSLAVAHLAKLVARYTTLDPQVAFTCGLLHDVGITAALMIHGDNEGAAAPAVDFKELWPSIRPVHEGATAWLCGRWRLPSVLAESVSRHHGVKPGAKHSTLAAVVALADGLAPVIGFPALDEVDPQQVPSALQALGLTGAQHQALLNDAASVQAHVICR